jgi:hypothetical protein
MDRSREAIEDAPDRIESVDRVFCVVSRMCGEGCVLPAGLWAGERLGFFPHRTRSAIFRGITLLERRLFCAS